MSDPSAHRAQLDALDAHLTRHLRPSTGRAHLDTSAGPLEILRFEPMPGTLVLVTFGASRSPAREEAILALSSDPPEPVLGAACAALAAFGEASGRGGPGLDGFLPAPEVLEGFDVDALLLLPPLAFAEGLAACEVPGLGQVRLRWLIPGFEEELEYLRAHGPEALLHLLRAQRLDLQDFGRAPASTLVRPEDAARLAGADTPEDDRGYRVEQVRGGVRIERRRRKIGQARARRDAPPDAPSDAPAPPSTAKARRGSRPRAAPSAKRKAERPRFDLGPSAPADAPPPPEPRSPAPAEPPLDPVEAKRQRIAELKAKALEARERAEARRRGEAPPPAPPAPEPAKPAPEASRAVLAAERRRGRRGKSGGRAAPRGPSRGGPSGQGPGSR